MKKTIINTVSIGALLLVIGVFFADVHVSFVHAAMQSSNYQISYDAVDNSGLLSSSTNFSMQDAVGEQSTGSSSSAHYTVGAGYEQMLPASSISISMPTSITIPEINGAAGGGVSTSSMSWNVLTDNSAGYSLYINSPTAPALASTSGASFQDYTPAGSDPDFAFSISASQSAFGFSPKGSDVISRFKDNGSICNAGSSETTNACWDGLSTTGKLIAQSGVANTPSGTATTVNLEVKIGSAKNQQGGTYTANIVATALTL